MYLSEPDLGNAEYSDEPRPVVQLRFPLVHRPSTSISPTSVPTPLHRHSIQESSLFQLVDSLRISFTENLKVKQLSKPRSGEHTTDQNAADLQFSHEEKQTDAIFKVFVKQTRPRAPASNSNSVAEVQLTLDETSRGNGQASSEQTTVHQLRAGTLARIVECLTDKNGALDRWLMHVLFATYRTFTDTSTLVDLIVARYRAVLPASLDLTEDERQNTLKNLRMAIASLISMYKDDFFEPPDYRNLQYLMEHIEHQDVREPCRNLLNSPWNHHNENGRRLDPITTMLEVDANNNNTNHAYPNDYLLSWNFLDVPSEMIAEQLTVVDAALFKSLRPHECLTKTSSSSTPNPSAPLSTVDQTVEQVNAVTKRVMAMVVTESDEQLRARTIEKWIDIAERCRTLNNISSLTAILNGLLSQSVYRLAATWSHVTLNHRSILQQLQLVFSVSADPMEARKFLDKQLNEIRQALPECAEESPRYVDPTTLPYLTLEKKLRKRKKSDLPSAVKGTRLGTIPYLGTYLGYFTNTHSANVDYVHIDGNSPKLINFEKRRKQFKILAEIKLLQSTVHACTARHPSPQFQAWFSSVRTYSEAESWQLSIQLQPMVSTSTVTAEQRRSWSENLPATSQVRRRGGLFTQSSVDSFPTENEFNGERTLTTTSDGSSPWLNSASNLSSTTTTTTNSSPRLNSSGDISDRATHSPYSRSSSSSSSLSSQGYPSADNETVIAKVHLQGREDLWYTTIRIGNNERVPNLLKHVLEKFQEDPSTFERYCIEQKLPDRNILLLDNCNIFYAIARPTTGELVELIVREKTRAGT